MLIEPSVARKVVSEFARLAPKGSNAPRRYRDQPGETLVSLSEREFEVLELLAHGLTNREIAARLYLAEGTVKNYVTNILNKIGARDRTQAALRARELGIL